MKFLGVVFLTFSFSFNLFGQDTSRVIASEPAVVHPARGPVLSSNPTALEFADLFTTGEIGESEAISRAVEKGDNAVAGLKALLFSETIRGAKRQPSDTGGFVPNKVAVVLALEGIGTEQSFAVLVRAANSHKNSEVRGVALNALSTVYYRQAQQENLIPDSDVIEALVKSLDDEAYVRLLQKPVRQIAQEGLLKWVGLDFGDPQFEEARIVAAGGKYSSVGQKGKPKNWDPEVDNKKQPQLSAAAYAKLWWEENKSKVSWDKEKKHFTTQ